MSRNSNEQRLPFSRRVLANQRNNNELRKLIPSATFSRYAGPENEFLDENQQFSTRNSISDDSGIRVGIVKDRRDDLKFRMRHRPMQAIFTNPWNLRDEASRNLAFANLTCGPQTRYHQRKPYIVNSLPQKAKNSISEKDTNDWGSLIVDPEDSNTFDWNDESELGIGQVVTVQGFTNSEASDEGILPRPNIFPYESCRPLSFKQLMTLEQKILLADYEIDSVRFPPIRVAPVDIISRLKRKIGTLVEGARIESIRIMGGVASHIINTSFPYNDLDILFNLTFEFDQRHRIFKQIRNQVCLVLLDILVQECPQQLEKVLVRDNLSHEHASTHFPTAYFQKYIVVPPAHDKSATEEDDCWSLICLRNLLGQNLEFKFVRCSEGVSLKRHFEFSSDSFQIVVDDIYLGHMENVVKRRKRQPGAQTLKDAEISADSKDEEIDPEYQLNAELSYQWLPQNKDILFPHVYVVCMYPDFDDALSHLKNRHVKIYRPEELRGGGLLKYAYLRQNDFRDNPNETAETLRLAINAMVCRFLITSPDSQAQWHTISKYLETHYPRQYPRNLDKRVNYLMILLNILAQSSAYAIEQAKSLYGVIKSMMDWIRNEMKEIEKHQQKGEVSDFRGWSHKYAATPGVPGPKLTHNGKFVNPVYTTFRQMTRIPGTLQPPPSHQPPRPAKKIPHPVEYRTYQNGFSHPESRLQTISTNPSFNEHSLRSYPSDFESSGILLTHQPMNNHVRLRHVGPANGTSSLQWDAWCQ